MPVDADTLSFSLTYGGTLLLALLMFIGQLTAAMVLLVFSGTMWLTVYLIQALGRALTKQDRP